MSLDENGDEVWLDCITEQQDWSELGKKIEAEYPDQAVDIYDAHDLFDGPCSVCTPELMHSILVIRR